jgi:SAM-dependent methyltransferase
MTAASFYDRIYREPGYADFSSPAEHFAFGVVSGFVKSYQLESKRCLEVGCGRGLFQDLTEDYTGVDLSASVAAYLRKPFFCCDATRLPFEDCSFDAIWSITVLEHIPAPELALEEMRRVLKPGGLLFLKPAWHCRTWICEGLPVRDYADLSWRQKWVKATLPIREMLPLRAALALIRRLLHLAAYGTTRGAAKLRFDPLPADYETFWMVDSDAAAALDPYDAILWFRSRGDLVLSHPSILAAISSRAEPLVVKVQHADYNNAHK